MKMKGLNEKEKTGHSNTEECMGDRRKEPRIKEESDVTITVVSEGKRQKIIYDSSKDISAYGARIHSRDMFPIDTLLELDFITKTVHQNITALGKVKWIKVIIEDQSYEVGVEFVKTPGDAIKKLEDYISWKQEHKNQNPFDVPI
jgi:hypothetical protein